MSDNEDCDISPKKNTFLMGHEEAEEFLKNSWLNSQLHNSILISGTEGIGKATLAYKFAKYILSKNESAVDSDSLIINNSHPDFKIIERSYTETDKKKLFKSIKDGNRLDDEELKGLKKSAFIKVDEVRTINSFLSKKSGTDGWRVVLIDSIDDMNANSANAVLKILEEPPYKTLILLISHNPNKLLATIKSRCIKINLKPLSKPVIASLLRRYRPKTLETEVKKLAEISNGSIGKAINYADLGAVKKYDDLNSLIMQKEKFSIVKMHSLLNDASSNEDSYLLLQEMLLKIIKDNIKTSKDPKELAGIWFDAIKVFDDVDRLNLDKKQALTTIIVNISKRI